MNKYISYVLSVCLICGLIFLVTEKAFSQASQKENQTNSADSVITNPDGTSAYVSGITAGRAKALVGSVTGLISLVIGGRAKVRSSKNAGKKPSAARVALVTGLIAIVLSLVHLSTTAGAVFGSGSGKAGAIVGLVLGLIGMTFGGQALRKKTV